MEWKLCGSTLSNSAAISATGRHTKLLILEINVPSNCYDACAEEISREQGNSFECAASCGLYLFLQILVYINKSSDCYFIALLL
jgi:hypothetical protein